MAHSPELSLLCRVHTRLCTLPISQVIETMRPLPIEPMQGAPAFVCGVAIIRGQPVPVLDTAQLLGTEASPPERFVTLRVGDRQVALAVSQVVGIRAIPEAALHALPPLLQETQVVDSIGALDAELLLVLNQARLTAMEPA